MTYGTSDARERSTEQVPYFPEDEVEVAAFLLCEGCEAPSTRVHDYKLLRVILIPPFGFEIRVYFVRQCPKCMRWYILTRLPIAIVLSNLLSPVVVVWWLVVLVRTFFRRGDSQIEETFQEYYR